MRGPQQVVGLMEPPGCVEKDIEKERMRGREREGACRYSADVSLLTELPNGGDPPLRAMDK